MQENDIVRNKGEPKEEKRVKKLMSIEDPKRIQITGREKEKATAITRAEIPEKS